jgi:hypothetical protein
MSLCSGVRLSSPRSARAKRTTTFLYTFIIWYNIIALMKDEMIIQETEQKCVHDKLVVESLQGGDLHAYIKARSIDNACSSC